MKFWKLGLGMVGGFGGSCGYSAYARQPATDVYVAPKEAGARKQGLKDFSAEEIRKHKNAADGIWVTFRSGVYDITDFVEAHPGGEKILMAAGGSIEPFWQIYQVHRESSITMKLLESMRIGNLSPKDRQKELEQAAKDPYSNEPPRHPALEVLSLRPFNAEPPKELLSQSFFTPNDTFYIRNHLPVPHVKGEDYKLKVLSNNGEVLKELSIDYLKKNFQHTTIPVTIQCAGNRRTGMSKVRSVDGLMWGTTAISTATWTGVKLSDVLRHCGVSDSYARSNGIEHVVFDGHDGGLDGKYGASISYDRAVDTDADVLLAWEMNGQEIPLDHGYPLRAVVPGLVGARSVKWLDSVTVSKLESQSLWQQKDYKNIGPSFLDRLSASLAAKEAPAVREMPVQSAILEPEDGESVKVKEGHITTTGYAWGGGGRGIQRVDVTADGGNSWVQASLSRTKDNPSASCQKFSKTADCPSPREWAWTLWQAEVPVPEKADKYEICVKAVNSANDTQPETPKGIWNLRGLLNNSWHCIDVTRA